MSGRQGHVASPQLADNPIRGLVALMSALMAQPLDRGTEHFAASNLEFTSVDVGNRTVNLIPGEARARFNIRFNDRHTQETLKRLVEARCREAAADKVRWRLEFEPSNSDVFLTKPGPFVDLNGIAAAHGDARALLSAQVDEIAFAAASASGLRFVGLHFGVAIRPNVPTQQGSA